MLKWFDVRIIKNMPITRKAGCSTFQRNDYYFTTHLDQGRDCLFRHTGQALGRVPILVYHSKT